jgi:drug/metabolite transporter (DMT)-like permease
MPAPVPWLAYACLAASMGLVGSYVGLSKLLVAVFPVLLLAWLRFVIAGLAMVSWLQRPAGEAPLSRRDRGLIFIEGFVGQFLFTVCMLYGIAATSAVAAGIVMAAMPAVVALLSRVVLEEPLGRRMWIATACSAAGIALLALGPEAQTAAAMAAPWWGYALLLAAVVCEAIYVVAGKLLTAAVSPRRISALMNLWSVLLLAPFGLWQAMQFDIAAVTARQWLLLVFYALAASVVSVALYMRGLREVPAARAGVFAVLMPAGAALVGILVLGEAFGPRHLLAFALALLAVLLATWPQPFRDRSA